jgi:Domain of unknown function (DUF5666)
MGETHIYTEAVVKPRRPAMSSKTRETIQMSRRRALAVPGAALLAGALGPALLAACGGGGGSDDSGAPTGGGGGAQSYVAGPISGLGSIIVGGVRFDDSSARIESEDDDDSRSRNRSELQLGMMVEVQASSIDDSTSRGTAALIRFGSEMKGPVASIDAAAQTIRVLDQTVEIRPETVFALGLSGFAAIQVGQILEIHAQFDAATGRYSATRIELEDNANEYRLRGLVSSLDTTAKTFKIGDAVINYAGVTELPANLADGQRVRVRLQTAQVGGQWVATRLRNGVRRVDDFGDARIRGLVTAFTSATQFEVQGVAVEVAAGARVEGAVAQGAMVEVRGRAEGGRIIASRVKVLDRDDDDLRRVELHGTVSALDTAAKTFMLREVKIDYSRVTEYKDGNESNLANGRAVEVKGQWSTDRSSLVASSIEFE